LILPKVPNISETCSLVTLRVSFSTCIKRDLGGGEGDLFRGGLRLNDLRLRGGDLDRDLERDLDRDLDLDLDLDPDLDLDLELELDRELEPELEEERDRDLEPLEHEEEDDLDPDFEREDGERDLDLDLREGEGVLFVVGVFVLASSSLGFRGEVGRLAGGDAEPEGE